MGFTFSTDQQSVIDARNSNVLVSAAAGSGKTAVLTERIVGLVTDANNPVDIDRVLVVTFTNAAAKEMKERIGKKLEEEVQKNPADSHLQKQTTLIHGALITTIDSFCLYLLKNHFHSINVDPSFRVADESEMTLLKADVLKDVMKRAYAEGTEDFYKAVDCYAVKDKDDSLEESIMSLYTYAMSYPWPAKWLENRRKDYSFSDLEAFENSDFLKKVREELTKKLEAAKRCGEKALETAWLPAGPNAYADTISLELEEMAKLISLINGKTWDEAAQYANSLESRRLKPVKGVDDVLKRAVSDARKEYKKVLEDIRDSFFSLSLSEHYHDMTECDRIVNKVIDLTLDFYESFNREKRERDIIDFSDMEHMAIDILIKEYNDDGSFIPTDVALAYQDFFSEVMVDEYQDSNLVQEIIIRSVSREDGECKNRFMVGDVKQSIYRFRLARPEIFMEKAERYEKLETAKNRLITLKSNYRSRQSVISSVNAVFEKAMVKEVGGIDYDDDARLYFGADFPEDSAENKTEVIFVPKPGKGEEARKLEAEAMAIRILELKESLLVYDKDRKVMRPVKYSDFSILFRSPVKWIDVLKKTFLEHGIPFHAEGVGTFYESTEITTVISFLKILNNPLDDISLYAVMTSPFFGFTDEECARIKALSTGVNRFLWDKVKSYSTAFPDEKVLHFIEMVERYRKLSRVCLIDELISRLFDETGYKHIVAAMPGGEQRLANVLLLITKARMYSKTSFYGLFHFIRYLELMKKTETDEGEANIFDENSDTVRVMSIHKSKGLEFPICFIGGIDEAFNEMDLRKEFVTDIDEGVGASFIDPIRRVKRNTIKKDFIISKLRNEAIGEETRILYVGMTRAKEKLLMFGACKDINEWVFAPGTIMKRSYADMIHDSVNERPDLFLLKFIDEDSILINRAAQSLSISEQRLAFEENVKNADEELIGVIKDRLSFKYPYEALSHLYTKTTVSELKMAAMSKEDSEALHPFAEKETDEYVPSFAGGSAEVKGTDRGTAYHNLLQLLHFEDITDEMRADRKLLSSFLKGETDRMVEREEMSSEDVSKVFSGKILDFLMTDTAREMSIAAKKNALYKEQPFVIGVSADSIEADFPSDETILVQGVIDVYFISDGKVTVLDYKTDRVENGEQLINRYKKQLDYYGEAIEKLTGLPVFRKLIYSFGLNEVIMVE